MRFMKWLLKYRFHYPDVLAMVTFGFFLEAKGEAFSLSFLIAYFIVALPVEFIVKRKNNED